MKKSLLLLIFFISQTNFAQITLKNDITTNFPSEIELLAPIGDTIFTPSEHQPLVLNINFHVINEDDGSRALPIGEEEVMNVIRDLNIKFGAFKIYFKYKGFDQINKTEYLNLKIPNINEAPSDYGYNFPSHVYDYAINNNYHNNQSINIFIFDTLRGQNVDEIVPGTVSYFQQNASSLSLPNIFIMAEYLNTPVIIHEMGHVFYLYHTNRSGSNLNGACEHVQRDANQTDYNAHMNGDRIIDTPASPAIYNSHEIDGNCKYIGNQVDCIGALYNTHLVPIKNYMNVNLPEFIYCQEQFSNGQGVYMRTVIDEVLSNSDNIYTTMGNTVASLYEPFEVMDVPGDVIVSVTPVETGGATVCRNILRQHRFQKGFNCRFQGTVAPDSTTSGPDDISIVKNNTLQFKIRINELDPVFYQPIDVICTRGVICGHETYRSGKVLSTPQLGSYNFNIEPLNEAQVNDPNLIETLENNQFHVITKETESGASNQTTIYKN